MPEESPHSRNEQRLAERAQETEKNPFGVEDPHLVSPEDPVHSSREEGKRNQNGERAQSVCRAMQLWSLNTIVPIFPRLQSEVEGEIVGRVPEVERVICVWNCVE